MPQNKELQIKIKELDILQLKNELTHSKKRIVILKKLLALDTMENQECKFRIKQLASSVTMYQRQIGFEYNELYKLKNGK